MSIDFPAYTVELSLPPTATDAFEFGDDPDGKFGTGRFTGEEWVDITDQVISGSVTRGARGEPFWIPSAGTARLVLIDQDHDLDPSNLSSPYATATRQYVAPGAPLRIIGPTISGTPRHVFHGRLTRPTPAPLVNSPGTLNLTTLTAVEDIAVLAGAEIEFREISIGSVGPPVRDTIIAILDQVEWPQDRRTLDAFVTPQRIDTTVDDAGSAWDLCARAAFSGLGGQASGDGTEYHGEVWMDQNGDVVYADSHVLENDYRTTVVATFRDTGTATAYRSVVIVGDDRSWANEITASASATGKADVTSTDISSLNRFGKQPVTVTNWNVGTDASRLGSVPLTPRWSFDELVLDARHSTNQRNRSFTLDMNSLVRIFMTRADGTEVDARAVVRSVEHQWSHQTKTWSTKFGLQRLNLA